MALEGEFSPSRRELMEPKKDLLQNGPYPAQDQWPVYKTKASHIGNIIQQSVVNYLPKKKKKNTVNYYFL